MIVARHQVRGVRALLLERERACRHAEVEVRQVRALEVVDQVSSRQDEPLLEELHDLRSRHASGWI